MTHRERVERGAAMLPPRWHEKVNAATLDISNPFKCILGQLYGGYGRGLTVLGISSWASELGFNGENKDDQDAMTEAWRELIAQRRLAEVYQVA
jgi:hypothetical protein